MGDSLPRMPINRRAKFDAASFILGGEIRNRTNTQNYKQTNTSVFGGRPYIHTCRRQVLPIDASPLHWQRARSKKGTGVYRQYLPPRADLSDFGLLGEQSSPKLKMGDSMPRTPMKHRAKFEAASFIPGGEIRNRVTNPLNELAIIRLKTRKAFHTFLQAAGRASQQACVTWLADRCSHYKNERHSREHQSIADDTSLINSRAD